MFTRTLKLLCGATMALVMTVPAHRARADDPAANPPTALTDAEKAKIKDLVKLMWKMQRDAAPNETLDGALNPPGQGGLQTCYETTTHPPPFNATNPTKITDALREYLKMMRNDKLVKDPCIWGAATWPKPGLGNDKVAISGKVLALWCDPLEAPAVRAKAKMQMMASMANEISHVYQKPAMAAAGDPPYTPAQVDLVECDDERDSDIMSIKFLQYAKSLLTTPLGVPHTSLAQISAEGRSGECLAECLMNLGADTPAELADITAFVCARLDHYTDRESNLFSNAINNTNSWSALYYDGLYHSPLRLKVDLSMILTRMIRLCYDNIFFNITVPNDGKAIVNYIVTVNKNGRVIIIVITMGADGSICFHTWEDTNDNGVPDTGPTTVAIPGFPFFGDAVPALHDGWLLHPPFVGLGFNDTLAYHDRRNGSLTVFDMNNAGVPTGAYRTLLRGTLIADPLAGNPSAGGYKSLHVMDFTAVPGSIKCVFRNTGLVSATPESSAVVGLHNIATGIGAFQAPTTLASAIAPISDLGVDHIPPHDSGLLVMSHPGDTFMLSSIGHGSSQLITLGTIGPNGSNNAGSPPIQPGPDVFRLQSLMDGATTLYAKCGQGTTLEMLSLQLVGGPSPDLLVLSGFPGRLAVFNGDAAPNYQWQAEVATQEADPGMLFAPGPTGPVFVTNFLGDVQVRPIPGSPLVAQGLADLDGDGQADDAAVIARLPSSPNFVVYMVLNATSPTANVIQSVPIPFEPGGYSYVNVNGDNRADLRIEDALGGPALCLISNGPAGFAPGPCPEPCVADFNHSGTLEVQDIFDFLNAWFAGNPAADVNGGGLAVSDIFAFLNLWFAGC
ncbi:MAG TPA: GC-type dockerin domain-anchored protein [Phycisphaerales bacterium]|nr:GC-type dockerin domain-anchored protein [Phycisphaerales bacterium]